jgi:ComF family protein
MIRDAANALLCALLTPPCVACGTVLDRPLDGAVCDDCWMAVAPRAIPLPLPSIEQARSIGLYEGTLRDLLHALKYEGRRSIGPRLSRLMAAAATDVLDGACGVVPVPLHARRRRARGFNQAADLSRELGLPVIHALRRARATPPQVGLSADERQHNVREAFALRRTSLDRGTGSFGGIGKPRIQGRVIVLVDDVATTGATLEACARVLRAAGAAEIRALTAARVVTEPRRPHPA